MQCATRIKDFLALFEFVVFRKNIFADVVDGELIEFNRNADRFVDKTLLDNQWEKQILQKQKQRIELDQTFTIDKSIKGML